MIKKQYAILDRDDNYLQLLVDGMQVLEYYAMGTDLAEFGPIGFFNGVTLFDDLETAQAAKESLDKLYLEGESGARVVCVEYEWPPKMTPV